MIFYAHIREAELQYKICSMLLLETAGEKEVGTREGVGCEPCRVRKITKDESGTCAASAACINATFRSESPRPPTAILRFSYS